MSRCWLLTYVIHVSSIVGPGSVSQAFACCADADVSTTTTTTTATTTTASAGDDDTTVELRYVLIPCVAAAAVVVVVVCCAVRAVARHCCRASPAPAPAAADHGPTLQSAYGSVYKQNHR